MTTASAAQVSHFSRLMETLPPVIASLQFSWKKHTGDIEVLRTLKNQCRILTKTGILLLLLYEVVLYVVSENFVLALFYDLDHSSVIWLSNNKLILWE